MTRQTVKKSFWISVAGLLAATGALSARAQAASSPNVGIDVVLVYGSAQEGAVDVGLLSMQEHLQRRLPMRFGTLQTFDSKHFDLPMGKLAEMRLPDGSAVRILPIAVVDGRLQMHLDMPGVSTRLQVQSGRPVIMGGQRYQNGVVFVQLTSSFAGAAPTEDNVPGAGPEKPREPQLPRPPASRVVEQPPDEPNRIVQQPNDPNRQPAQIQRIGAER
jgi:hypothetical protein